MGNIQDIKDVSIRIQEAINSFETIIPSDNEIDQTLKSLRNDFNYLNSEVLKLVNELESVTSRADELSEINSTVNQKLNSVLDSIKSVIEEPA
ncbi:MAG: DUF4164 family protein [Methyloligellaceae bacterium]